MLAEDKVTTLVEVKSVRIRWKAEMTMEIELLRRELEQRSGIAEGLIQLDESARIVRAGGPMGSASEQFSWAFLSCGANT